MVVLRDAVNPSPEIARAGTPTSVLLLNTISLFPASSSSGGTEEVNSLMKAAAAALPQTRLWQVAPMELIARLEKNYV